MRAARKCGPTRGMHSTRFSTRLSRRPFRNPRQDSAKLLIAFVSTVVAEGVFVKIALQVLRRNRVVDAADPALHKTPESLNAVGMNVAVSHVLSRPVPNAIVRKIQRATPRAFHLRNVPIDVEVIGVNHAARSNVLADSSKQILAGNMVNDSRDCFSAALDNRDNRSFFLVSAHRATALPLADSTVVRFINFHRWPLQFQVTVRHKRSDLAEHAPRSFVGNASFALDLFCGYSATSGPHEIRSIEPESQRSARLLKDSSRERVDVMPAMVAGERSAIAYAVMLPFHVALRALRDAVRIALLCDMPQAGIIVRKLVIEVLDGVSQFFRDALFDFHISLTGESVP